MKHDESAMTDALTGVPNRHGFLLLAEQQLKVAVRNRIPVALLFADLDHLTTINVRHGHAEGDRALARVAAAIRASVRESVIVSIAMTAAAESLWHEWRIVNTPLHAGIEAL